MNELEFTSLQNQNWAEARAFISGALNMGRPWIIVNWQTDQKGYDVFILDGDVQNDNV